MREFAILALKAYTTSDFDLNKLKSAGRLDLVCRTISNTLWISNDLRRDTIIHVCMTGPKYPPKTISFYGEKLKNVEPDERTIAMVIKNALKDGKKLELGAEIETHPGVIISKKAFETILKEKKDTHQIIYLNQNGQDIREFKFKKDILVILGDYIGLPRKTERWLKNFNAEKIKLGPIMLFASHCPIIVHNEIDRINQN